MQSVANKSEIRVDREMHVHDPGLWLNTSSDGEIGVVGISVQWDGLAGLSAGENAHLVVTEPFASGFTPSRQFTVRITAPDRFRITTVEPEPRSAGNATATWDAGTKLTGFTLVYSPGTSTPLPPDVIEDFQPTSPASTPSSDGMSLFGLAIGVLLLIVTVVGVVYVWRRYPDELL